MILFEIKTVMTPLKGVVRIGSSTTPESLTDQTGADVTGLPDNYVLAAGSTIECPTGVYVAFEDGSFTEITGPTEEVG